MIRLEIHHNWTLASWELDPAEHIVLEEATSYMTDSPWLNPSFIGNGGWWDGKTCLFKKDRLQQSGRFPTGIFHHALAKMKGMAGLRIDIVDGRVYPIKPREPDTGKITFELRDYQEESVKAFLQQRRGVIKLPTAAGKTKTAVAAIATLDVPTLWITHESSLAQQSLKAVQEGLSPTRIVGYYAGDEKRIERWTVALVQSLHRNLPRLGNWLKQVKLLVIDECHHGAANTWYEVAMSCDAPFRLGISATPFERSDKSVLELVGSTGPLLYEKKPDDIKGYLSRPMVEFIHLPSKPTVVASQWDHVYKLGIVRNTLRNDITVERALRCIKERQICLIPVASRDHGAMLKDRLSGELGVDCFHEYINGDTPRVERERCFNDMRNQNLYCLIATDGVAGEGQDIPTISDIIVGGGLKGAIICKQRIGRGMRPDEIVEDCSSWGGAVRVIDFVDNNHHKLNEHSDIRRGHYLDVSALVRDNHDYANVVVPGPEYLLPSRDLPQPVEF